jgi:hypothetical protein
MELTEYLRLTLTDVHGMFDFAMQGLDEETVHWQPGGTANTIGALLAHVISGEDVVFNGTLRGGQTLFESQAWSPSGAARRFPQSKSPQPSLRRLGSRMRPSRDRRSWPTCC